MEGKFGSRNLLQTQALALALADFAPPQGRLKLRFKAFFLFFVQSLLLQFTFAFLLEVIGTTVANCQHDFLHDKLLATC